MVSKHAPPLSIHVAAQQGDIAQLQALCELDEAQVSERDEQDVTPLHWAAINGHTACAIFLLERGADPNAVGGELQATPLHWCSRSGQTRMIQLLLQRGADLLLKDKQGYNALHLTTHSSFVMAVLYMLQQDAFAANNHLDDPDPQGHTALMWAAFQGDAVSVDVLLKHGANVHSRDETGLTPLHWALVRGNRVCIEKLVASGADVHAKDNGGADARAFATDMKSTIAYENAMKMLRRDADGAPLRRVLTPFMQDALVFIVPMLVFTSAYYLMGQAPWYLVPFIGILCLILQYVLVAKHVLGPYPANSVQSSPYFLSLLITTLVPSFLCWLVSFVPHTTGLTVLNTVTGTLFISVFLTLAISVLRSPGRAPQPKTMEARRATIEDMVANDQLNGLFFCTSCIVCALKVLTIGAAPITL
ncbi:protein S-acyltransferase [Malassezia vespertilionis]|nr:protein S-acyltransferase [Malassezia vespertilionis]WFD06656.1 protein S-acyltransferase [Malassezia vespertilionis]